MVNKMYENEELDDETEEEEENEKEDELQEARERLRVTRAASMSFGASLNK